MSPKFVIFFLVVLVVGGWVFSGWPQVGNFPHPIETAYALKTLPAPIDPDGDGTDSASVQNEGGSTCDTVVCANSINDASSATFNETVNSTQGAVSQFYTLENMPADFDTMNSVQLDIKTIKSGTRTNDNITLHAQVLTSDEGTTELTDEVLVCTWDGTTDDCGGTETTHNIALTINAGNNTEANWNDARLELKWTITKTQSFDNNKVRVTEAALSDDYNEDVVVAEPAIEQVSWRFFGNRASTSVGSAASIETPIVAPPKREPFRLRLLYHVHDANLSANATMTGLQFARKDGVCDPGGAGESWTNVASSSGDIRYHDQSGVNDGDFLTLENKDPRRPDGAGGTETLIDQAYSEGFSVNPKAINTNENGLWDFALQDFSAPPGTTYCLRAVQIEQTAADAGDAFAYTGGFNNGGYGTSTLPEFTTAQEIKVVLRGEVRLRTVRLR